MTIFQYTILQFLCLGLCLTLCIENTWAQEQLSRRARAALYYERMEYANAAAAYERLLDTKKPRVKDMENLANSYLYIKEYGLAENWYSRVVRESNASKESHLKYADVLKQLGKYAQAKEEYRKYITKYGEEERLRRAIAGADSAISWMKQPTNHRLHNETEVNTSLAEFGLITTNKGALYVGEPNSLLSDKSGMTGHAYLRIYAVERHGDQTLSHASIMPESFNQSLFHVGPVSTNKTGDVLYVTRTNPGDTETEHFLAGGTKWKRYNLELLLYRRTENGWQEESFAHNDVTSYSLGHAVLSADEQVLYYASDMSGGYGGVDIWYSELLPDGNWSKPVNAGAEVNTSGDEMFPNVYGETLYFSSTGHIGMGGLDIFRSTGEKNRFSKPVNMGYPVNSASDDFSFFVTASADESSQGYLSSNRTGGVGSDDIYSFHYTRPWITIMLEAVTQNKANGELLPESTVTLFGPKGEIVAKSQSDSRAKVSFMAEPGIDYRLYGEKEGFFPDSLLFAGLKPSRDTTVRLTLNLQPIFHVGDKFVLENIYYDFDKHNIRLDAALILDKLVATMRDNPTLKIELSSHTDSRGSHRYNESLSQRRAQAAVDYLVTRGIARDRMVAKGYGETRLVNKCADGVPCSVTEHQANRRTEIEVLDY
ncbi:OmpA family protein [Sphingobacterium sp. SGG-5]|nr:OmpA family protein [Sphingobacterium sp. SGG-5]